MSDIAEGKKEIHDRFKKGDEVCPLAQKTWGSVCGVPDGPYYLDKKSYVVAQDSAPIFSDEPDRYHWCLRLEKFPGIKFLAADFKKAD